MKLSIDTGASSSESLVSSLLAKTTGRGRGAAREGVRNGSGDSAATGREIDGRLRLLLLGRGEGLGEFFAERPVGVLGADSE